ncbi:hypothetical protein BAE44_0015703 [Dichanthelium oligosanthes]|uniref:F-box domain-containing protein n=1 Tax=Dichanthelium oligosanthes TaxID=888268 RepID=A0A1E5VE35_9POAL|nr:hypothetical protein BAE44_0015703 [Dichanthelium oligosanthes]
MRNCTYSLPPDDITFLLRASLACRRWRRVLADPAFLRQHRALHRTPSVPSFFRVVSKEMPYCSRYVQDNPASRRPAGCDLPGWLVLDCRHGRALFATPSPSLGTEVTLDLLVWNPLTGEQRNLPHLSPPPTTGVIIRNAGYITPACMHSSKTGDWSELASVHHLDVHVDCRPLASTFVGDVLYFCGNLTYAFEYQSSTGLRLECIKGNSSSSYPWRTVGWDARTWNWNQAYAHGCGQGRDFPVGMAARRLGYDNTRPDMVPKPYKNTHAREATQVEYYTVPVPVGYPSDFGYPVDMPSML